MVRILFFQFTLFCGCLHAQLPSYSDNKSRFTGFKDEGTGAILFKPQFKVVAHFLGYYVLADSAGSVGVITIKGKIVLPFSFSEVKHGPHSAKPYFFAREGKSELYYVYNHEGRQVLPGPVKEIKPIPQKKTSGSVYVNTDLVYRNDKDKYGLLDENFKTVFPPEFDMFSDRFFGPSRNWFFVKKGKYFQLIDRRGKVQYEDTLKFGLDDFAGGVAAFQKYPGSKTCLVNEKMEQLTDAVFQSYLPSPGKAVIIRKQLVAENSRNPIVRYGVIDHHGNCLIEPVYNDVELIHDASGFVWWHHGFAVVIKYDNGNKLYGMINSNGKEILEPIYEKLEFNFAVCDIILAKENGKWGILSTTGKILAPFVFHSIQYDFFYNNPKKFIAVNYERAYRPEETGVFRYFVQKEIVNGFFNCKKKKLAIDPRRFDSIGYEFQWEFYLGCIDVEHQGRYGLVNKRGKYVIPTTYAYNELFFEDSEDDTPWKRFWKIAPKIVKHWFIKDNWKGQH
ncbi:MAG TPA: WG repeat-containing protein [Flavobacteriales bacterium]|nr:WG repeat-containing protein [Flavobacteriales bacterium]